MRALRASAVQMRSELGDVAQNCEKVVALAFRAIDEGARIIGFPEACLTGYDASRSSELAEGLEHPCVKRLGRFAAEQGVVLSFGLIEQGEGLPYVTQVVCAGDVRFIYRKTHLGKTEVGHFAAGGSIDAVQVPDACLGVSLCWECCIPDIAGTLRAKGAEVLLAPFASPLSGELRLESWATYLPARAHDNGMYVVACNALKPLGEGGGGCAIYDACGKLMGSLASPVDDVLTVELDADLPRDRDGGEADDGNGGRGMRGISYFDRRRPELYS